MSVRSYKASACSVDESSMDIYKKIAACLAPHCDILLCETMSSISEAICAVTATAAYGTFAQFSHSEGSITVHVCLVTMLRFSCIALVCSFASCECSGVKAVVQVVRCY